MNLNYFFYIFDHFSVGMLAKCTSFTGSYSQAVHITTVRNIFTKHLLRSSFLREVVGPG